MLVEAIAQRFVKVSGMVGQLLTGLGSTRVAQTEGEGDEMTRAGLRYGLSAQGATGIAPVQTLMSTAAQWLIFNPLTNPATAFIDELGVILASGTAGAGGSVHAIIVGPNFLPTTVPTKSTANVFITNRSPVSQHASRLVVNSAATLVNAATSDWFPVAAMDQIGTVLGQTHMINKDIRGKMCIPPGCGIGIAVVSPVGTTPLYTPVGSWREYLADLE